MRSEPVLRGQRSWQADHDESRDRALMVVDVAREYVEPVPGRGERTRERGADLPVRGLPRRLRVGRGGPPLGRGQVRGQPAAALRLRVRMATDRLDLVECGPWPGQQRKCHRQQDLRANDQIVADGELVKRGRDRALHRVLDRDDGADRLAPAYRVERRLHGRIRRALGLGGLVQGAESGLGEGPFRAEVGVPIWHVLMISRCSNVAGPPSDRWRHTRSRSSTG